VLDAMRQTQQGIFQLGQPLTDFAQRVPLRAVDENGEIRKLQDGSGDLPINDIYLRGEFPPAGKKRAPRPGDTPQDHYHNRVAAFSAAMEEAKKAFAELGSVASDDGRPLVESQGVDYRACAVWRELLAEVDEELIVWSRTFRRTHGTGDIPSSSSRGAAEEVEEPFDESEWDEDENGSQVA
jgi:hypothetical protein